VGPFGRRAITSGNQTGGAVVDALLRQALIATAQAVGAFVVIASALYRAA